MILKGAATIFLGVSLLALTACEDRSSTLPVNRNIPVHTYGAGVGGGSLGMYTVRQGDTVGKIAQSYNLALRDVLDANDLRAPYTLYKGQRLTLPAPQTYKVRPGDSLYTVSRLFDTSTTEVARLNHLSAPYRITTGQVITLPPRYRPSPAFRQAAARPVPPPSVVTPSGRIDREPLAPPPVTDMAGSSGGRYVPPPSSSSEYVDDLPSSRTSPSARPEAAPAEVKKASASASAKVIAETPRREGKFLKPVAGRVISSYGLKKDGLHNDGVNIQAAKGDPVRAAENGVVVYTGNQIAGYGNLILIRHADQYVSAYAHLDKTLVKKGDTVKRGQTVGTVGQSGAVDKPQLHFEIRKGTKALDPSGLVKL